MYTLHLSFDLIKDYNYRKWGLNIKILQIRHKGWLQQNTKVKRVNIEPDSILALRSKDRVSLCPFNGPPGLSNWYSFLLFPCRAVTVMIVPKMDNGSL